MKPLDMYNEPPRSFISNQVEEFISMQSAVCIISYKKTNSQTKDHVKRKCYVNRGHVHVFIKGSDVLCVLTIQYNVWRNIGSEAMNN